jgi:hypothetical protein
MLSLSSGKWNVKEWRDGWRLAEIGGPAFSTTSLHTFWGDESLEWHSPLAEVETPLPASILHSILWAGG